MIVKHTQQTFEQLAARQIIASALASALADPRAPLARRCDGANLDLVEPAWQQAAETCASVGAEQLGIGERAPQKVDAGPLIEWLSLPAERREIAHQAVFGLVMTKLCPAYETEYCQWKDATHRAQEMADISGFYHAFGIGPNRAAPERLDHVALEVEFIALLLEKELRAMRSDDRAAAEHAGLCRDARQSFLRDHASWWMPTFGRLLEKRAGLLSEQKPEIAEDLRTLVGVAQVLCAWVALERIAAQVEPSRRLISPSVAPQEDDQGCGTCTTSCAAP